MKLQQIINEKLLKEQEERSKRVRSGLWSQFWSLLPLSSVE